MISSGSNNVFYGCFRGGMGNALKRAPKISRMFRRLPRARFGPWHAQSLVHNAGAGSPNQQQNDPTHWFLV